MSKGKELFLEEEDLSVNNLTAYDKDNKEFTDYLLNKYFFSHFKKGEKKYIFHSKTPASQNNELCSVFSVRLTMTPRPAFLIMKTSFSGVVIF